MLSIRRLEHERDSGFSYCPMENRRRSRKNRLALIFNSQSPLANAVCTFGQSLGKIGGGNPPVTDNGTVGLILYHGVHAMDG